MSAVTAQKEGLEVNWNQLYVYYYFSSRKDQNMKMIRRKKKWNCYYNYVYVIYMFYSARKSITLNQQQQQHPTRAAVISIFLDGLRASEPSRSSLRSAEGISECQWIKKKRTLSRLALGGRGIARWLFEEKQIVAILSPGPMSRTDRQLAHVSSGPSAPFSTRDFRFKMQSQSCQVWLH